MQGAISRLLATSIIQQVMHGCVGGSGGWESLHQLFLNKAPVRDTQLNPARVHGKCTPRRTFREQVPTLRVALPCDFRAPSDRDKIRTGTDTQRSGRRGSTRCSLLFALLEIQQARVPDNGAVAGGTLGIKLHSALSARAAIHHRRGGY